jgi:hypothetical protein
MISKLRSALTRTFWVALLAALGVALIMIADAILLQNDDQGRVEGSAD